MKICAQNAQKRRKEAHILFIACVHIYASSNKFVHRLIPFMSLSFKFHKDPSFYYGDICKTLLAL